VAGQAELTSRQRRSLAEDGYLLLPSVLAADAVAAVAARLDELARAIIAERDAAGEQWDGVVSVRLDLADPGYAPLVRQPLLFSAAEAVIGPGCRVDGLGLRAPLPGCGHQGLHPDFFPGHRTSGPWQVLAAMWCITGFTRDNGPLRVIPGSHRSARDPVDDMEFPGMGPHPDEVKLTAPAGSLILFNSASLWHSGTLNYSPGLRLAVTTYLSAPAAARDGLCWQMARQDAAGPRKGPSPPGPHPDLPCAWAEAAAPLTGSRAGRAVPAACRLWRTVRFMSAAGLLAAVGGAIDAGGIGPDAAGSVRAELAKFAGAGSVQVVRARRNGGRVDAMLASQAGPRWAVVAGLDGQDRVTSLSVQREPAVFAGAPGGLVVVLNGPSSSGKSTLATAIQQAADTPWIRLLPDEFQVITCAAGLDGQAGWRRRLAGVGCLFTGLTPALAVCEQRERDRDDRAAGNAARESHAVHQGWAYDLDIDTGAVDPQRAAALVLAALADGKARTQ